MAGRKGQTDMEVRKELEALAEEEYRVFHSRLMPETGHPVLGVRVPALRKLAGRLARQEGAAYLEQIREEEETYEEVLLYGLVLALLKEPFAAKLSRLPDYVKKIDNWAECDIVCGTLRECRRYPEEALAFIDTCLSSGREFEVRFGVVLLLDHLIDESHIDGVLDRLEVVCHPGYYVKMAVAWALSVCFVKFPEKTMERLKRGRLDWETYQKTLQKIVESDRVDGETKQVIRGMRRKRGEYEQ